LPLSLLNGERTLTRDQINRTSMTVALGRRCRRDGRCLHRDVIEPSFHDRSSTILYDGISWKDIIENTRMCSMSSITLLLMALDRRYVAVQMDYSREGCRPIRDETSTRWDPSVDGGSCRGSN
jgi:hypothetical protein